MALAINHSTTNLNVALFHAVTMNDIKKDASIFRIYILQCIVRDHKVL